MPMAQQLMRRDGGRSGANCVVSESAVDPAVAADRRSIRTASHAGAPWRRGSSMNIFYIYQLIFLNLFIALLDYHDHRPTSQQRKPR
jgi:hypothetical protein